MRFSCAAMLLFCLAWPFPALAHRLNVFAYAEGERVFVEAQFRGATPARNSAVTVRDGTGTVLHEGLTDATGRYDFARPASGELSIEVNAGEGHRGTWKLAAENDTPPPLRVDAPARMEPEAAAAPPEVPPAPTVSSAELEALMETVLERKLAPIRQMLIQRELREPGLRDVLGGLGWIAGLVGVAAWVASRRRTAG